MITRKTTAVAFIAILITAWLMLFFTQVEAQTLEQQKEALIGEWNGAWPPWHEPATLIIHEIDTENAKARCTWTSAARGEKKYQPLADFTPGPNPKLAFKVEMGDLQFVLKDKVLWGTFKGVSAYGQNISLDIKMEKKPKK